MSIKPSVWKRVLRVAVEEGDRGLVRILRGYAIGQAQYYLQFEEFRNAAAWAMSAGEAVEAEEALGGEPS